MIIQDLVEPLLHARARIANAFVAPRHPLLASLGTIALRPHQLDGADRLLQMLARDGGALLADHVGVGKTYAALAVARHYARPIVVAPAAVREVWSQAAKEAAFVVPIVTMEGMSRGERASVEAPDLVIIDEAHHVRTSTTQRYETIAALCRQAHVLLLSATPVQNRRADIEAQLALFMGARAATLTDAELATHIVRRAPEQAGVGVPIVDGPHPLNAAQDDDCLRAILSIPAPLPAADEGVAGALTVYSLVHLWASSRAALVASLRRRRARAVALLQALQEGRLPTRRELTAWCFDGSAMQLTFPTLIARTEPTVDDAHAAIERLDLYCGSIAAVLASLGHPDPDDARAEALAMVRARHAGHRIVAFSQYAETVQAYTRHLRRMSGVAELTARGGRITSGALPRREVLAQFAPHGASTNTGSVDRIELLVTTDVLSEGVNLHGASVVVHLDLPWNPARLEQRVGRLRRLGSPHDRIHVYAMMPPAAAERLLEIERRLRDKLATAGAMVGVVGRALPSTATTRTESAAELMQATRDALRPWLGGGSEEIEGESCQVAAARSTSSVRGYLALVSSDGEPSLVASLGGPPTTDQAVVNVAVRAAGGAPCDVDDDALAVAWAEIAHWMQALRTSGAIGLRGDAPTGARSTALHRVTECVHRAPRHRRATIVGLASTARRVLSGRLSAGAERVLSELDLSSVDDEAWLHAVSALGAFEGAGVPPDAGRRTEAHGERGDRDGPPPGLAALILFRP